MNRNEYDENDAIKFKIKLLSVFICLFKTDYVWILAQYRVYITNRTIIEKNRRISH